MDRVMGARKSKRSLRDVSGLLIYFKRRVFLSYSMDVQWKIPEKFFW